DGGRYLRIQQRNISEARRPDGIRQLDRASDRSRPSAAADNPVPTTGVPDGLSENRECLPHRPVLGLGPPAGPERLALMVELPQCKAGERSARRNPGRGFTDRATLVESSLAFFRGQELCDSLSDV